MNSLSWLLYAADVSGQLDLFLFCGACLFALTSVFTLIGSVGGWDCESDEAKSAMWKHAKIFLPCFCLFFIISGVVPSKETMYLIAASELGEAVLETPELDKVRQIINGKLDSFMEEPTEETP